MIKHLSEYLKVSEKVLENKGVFNSVIGMDTRLFLDPHLLKSTQLAEFKESRTKILDHYSDIIRLLLAFKKTNSLRAKRSALARLTFKEIKGLSIGYGNQTGDGNAIGRELANKLLTSAMEILDMGIEDPEIFELIGLFEDGFGADRLSDMTISIIKEDIYAYTQRVATEIGVDNGKLMTLNCGGQSYSLPRSPLTRYPILFLPKELLRDLPVALDWEGIDHVVSTNRQLRERLNEMIGIVWKNKIKKYQIRSLIMSNKDNLVELLNAYKSSEAAHYDFDRDPLGEISWLSIGHQYVDQYPVELKVEKQTLDEVESVVLSIVNQFKRLIEVNGLNKNMYDTSGDPLPERYAQRLFFAIADGYCAHNNLDISPETNSGSGPVDFKISKGYDSKVLVETKLTSSKRVVHGFETQLPTYQMSEKTNRGIYLVIKNTRSNKQIVDLRRSIKNAEEQGEKFPKVIIVDAVVKPSASRR